MPAPEGPTVADRYLRSIAFGVGAVMVSMLAFPLAAGLALTGLILEERARDSEPFGFETFGVSKASDQSDLAPYLYLAAAVVFVVAVVAILVLAARSLAALGRAAKERPVGPVAFPVEAERRPRPSRPTRRASAFPAAPMLATTPSSPDANGSAERVVVLTDREKARLGDVGPASGTPGWYVDPLGQAEGRWWNGTEWTGRLQG